MKAKLNFAVLSVGVLLLCLFSMPSVAARLPAHQTLEAKKSNKTSKIDLNQADLKTLNHSFKGIGKSRAEAIIAYREEHKGFQSVEELAKVKGFGSKFVKLNLKQLKQQFTVEENLNRK